MDYTEIVFLFLLIRLYDWLSNKFTQVQDTKRLLENINEQAKLLNQKNPLEITNHSTKPYIKNKTLLSNEIWSMVMCYLPRQYILRSRLINKNFKSLVRTNEELSLLFLVDEKYKINILDWNHEPTQKHYNDSQKFLAMYLELFTIPSVNYIKSQSQTLKHKNEKFVPRGAWERLGVKQTDFGIFEVWAYLEHKEYEEQILELLKHVPFCAQKFAYSTLGKVAKFANSHNQFAIGMKYKKYEFESLEELEKRYNIFAVANGSDYCLYENLHDNSSEVWYKLESEYAKKYPTHFLKRYSMFNDIEITTVLLDIPRHVIVDFLTNVNLLDCKWVFERPDHAEIFHKYQKLTNSNFQSLSMASQNADFEFFMQNGIQVLEE